MKTTEERNLIDTMDLMREVNRLDDRKMREAPCRACDVDDLKTELDEAPTIEAEPIRHGKWRKVDYQICVGKGAFVDALECSVCEEPNYEMSKYCPYCGAKMDEDEISNIAKESADKISNALDKVRAKGMQKQNIKEDDEP